MSRSIFTSAFRYLSDFVRPAQTPTSNSTDPHGLTRGREREKDDVSGAQYVRSSGLQGYAKRKRKAEEEHPDEQPTKLARNKDRLASLPYDGDANSNMAGRDAVTRLAVNDSTRTQEDIDRTLMPPPPTPHRFANYKSRQGRDSSTNSGLATWRDDDAISFASSTLARRKIDDMDDHAMEEARRHAAAIRLPPNSGIWSQTEREVFFHLAYRGFEALLPENWMLDFDTLPISLFADANTADPVVIHNVRDNQFRACHALRRLFEAGHDVRDRTHVSPGSKRERILEQAVRRYLYWALTDVGLRPSSSSKYIPVHAVVTKRTGRSTLQTLEEIAIKLHGLSQRHHQAQGVHPSIEVYDQHTGDADETRLMTDNEFSPTLVGLVIISSVLAIVTLSPFSGLAPEKSTSQTVSPPNSVSNPSTHATEFNPDRLRIIAEFDFSQKDQDVWNALGVAIVAMQIRKEALKANFGLSYDDIDVTGGETISMDGSRFDDLDETSGNVSKLDVDNDPDL
ncbi:hypothetical protein A1O3_04851 [Capronia epimyces CBS 606.96]|uniref:Uncharacterized protein n=1 Tax=Capronia epimyces CBS 606.96 TaxID=1182542 RepID=W9YPJ1_9EURO|nr:uncharacterized protein A1O3_04851 [Capronia epimyces CBS 606.96]EXJ84184.1 hypothetical protein A1O3_04851 [Capronia epimyces CBS 606.96]